MAALAHVHVLVQGIDVMVHVTGVPSVVDVTRIISVAFDHILPHMDLSTIGMLAQTCKSFRALTSDVGLLDYVMRLLPQRNSHATRRCFLIPRSMPLSRISRGLYSQAHSLHSAIQKYGGMHEFRGAVRRRRELTIKRRAMLYIRTAVERASRGRRLQMVIHAVDVLKLPVLSRYRASAALFINNVPPIHESLEEDRLSVILDNMCWVHHLFFHTDFCEQCESRRELVGDYEGLERDVMDGIVKPDVWPWLV
ncbi:hypothetical protein T484DRAFT_1757967 [Baffinella frigidus]|nr:hypothetical protein T484DRAFT_1757967 [Cryptophyta sp. CCMP2293]